MIKESKYLEAKRLVEEYQEQNGIKNSAILFADFLISDYDIINQGDDLLWQLCGTKQRYSSEEIYQIFLDQL